MAQFLGHNQFDRQERSPMVSVVGVNPATAARSARRGLKGVVLLISWLLLPAGARSQVRSGSIVVMSRSRQRVIIAADSRVNFGGGKYEDTSCKITALSDKLIFAATGIVGDSSYLLPGGLRFDARGEANRVFIQYSQAPANFLDLGTVGTIASNWGAAMAEHFRAAAEASPASLEQWLKRVELSHEPTFVVGVFAGLEPDGEISVYSVNVEYAQSREGAAPSEPYLLTSMPVPDDLPGDVSLLTPFGMSEIVNEIREGKTDRAKQEINARDLLQNTLSAEAFARSQAIRLVDLTIAYHAKQEFVGGRIDAVELRRAGKLHWLQRKENCPEN
jgi:hypothetical protein